MFDKKAEGFTVGDGEIRAFLHAIAPFTVALLPPDGHSVGTGTLINWKSSHLILTANHNLDGTKPSLIRFVFNPGGTLREGPMTREDSRELYRGVLLPVEDNSISDLKNDIAAIRLNSDNLPPAARFCEIDSRAQIIKEGSTVVLAGFAWDNSFLLEGEARAVGVTMQSGTFDSALNATPGLSSAFKPEDHFLLPYTRIDDGVQAVRIQWGGRLVQCRSARCRLGSKANPRWHSDGLVSQVEVIENRQAWAGLGALIWSLAESFVGADRECKSRQFTLTAKVRSLRSATTRARAPALH
jgi:hypothetical protein